MHETNQVYIFMNIVNSSIQIHACKTQPDLSGVRLINSCLNNRLPV